MIEKKLNLSLLIVSLFVLKLILALITPVFADEAYYYIWSLHPQLSYFDHPAMVSWLISLGHQFLPDGHALSLRLPFVVLSLLTSLIWVKILKFKLFNQSQIMIFILLVFLNPLLGVGSIMATPDVPLLFFWSLAYYFYIQLLENKNWFHYLGLGISLGLGFCSKYHIVLFVISGLAALVFLKKWKNISLKGVFITLVSGFITSLPVLIWNAQNNWASFLFQIDHGFGEETFDWQWPLNYVLTQILLMSPFLFVLLVKKVRKNTDFWFSWTQLSFFLTSSFKSVVEGNWPISSHLHIISGTLSFIDRRWLKYIVINWIILYSLIGLFFSSDTSEKVRKNLINSSQFEEIYPLVDKYKPLYGPTYQVSALISWKTQVFTPKLNDLSRHDFFDSLPQSVPQTKEFYALKYDNGDWPEKYNSLTKTKLESFDKLGLSLYHLTYE